MTKETLLIVEDNPVLREGLREMLSYEGFRVIAASNGREALEHMNTLTPDLILSDITMPEMDGFAFFNHVRARQDWVSIPFIFLTARTESEDVLAGKKLGAEDYLTKPLTREELVTAVRGRLARSRQIHMFQLQQAYENSLTIMANAIDRRDGYPNGHVERVTAYTMTMAAYLGWQDRRLEVLRYAAILHDIGKIHVRECVLFKREPLTAEEWEEIRRHPITGAEMVKYIPHLAPTALIIRHHHEQWDGKGYPDGLVGDAIPLGARIISVADSFDAMTNPRPYQEARSLEQGLKELVACTRTRYDPGVIEAFRRAWQTGQIQSIASTWKQPA